MGNSFTLGKCVVTKAIAETFNKEDLLILLARYAGEDWEELKKEDREANVRAMEKGGRIFSKYTTDKGVVWIFTEADRSSTTILFPNEY